MAKLRSLGIVLAAWLATAAWTVPWAVFRGENAHGGYVWWQRVHHGGLVLLLFPTVVLIARGAIWNDRNTRVLAAAGFAISLFLATWLAFQVGLARHAPPGSVAEFLLNEP